MIHEYIIKVDDEKKDILELLQLAEKPKTLVRCKDCKHRPIKQFYNGRDYQDGYAIKFPDWVCPYQCEDGYYSRYTGDDWFCHEGELREDDKKNDR